MDWSYEEKKLHAWRNERENVNDLHVLCKTMCTVLVYIR